MYSQFALGSGLQQNLSSEKTWSLTNLAKKPWSWGTLKKTWYNLKFQTKITIKLAITYNHKLILYVK